MRDLILLIGAGYVGWWLALNQEEETRRLLNQAKNEAIDLKNDLLEKARENEELKEMLDGIGSMSNIR